LTAPRAIPARTLRAYRQTCYAVEGIAVRIGRRCAAMDGLLDRWGAREAVFITAHNPFSRLRPPGWNRRMQQRLAQAVRRRLVVPAVGSWRRWSEDHLLVVGDDRLPRRLMRRFHQNAIVIVRRGQPARLLLGWQNEPAGVVAAVSPSGAGRRCGRGE
jgi:hypothetical protein